MAKKNFKNTSGFEGMFGEEKRERPAPVEERPVVQQNRNKRAASTSQAQYQDEIRYTFIADSEIIEKIKEIADYKRVKIKEVINYALGGVCQGKLDPQTEPGASTQP